jgi:hypothetical protein
MRKKFWSENFKEIVHLEDPGVDGKIVLNNSSRNRT